MTIESAIHHYILEHILFHSEHIKLTSDLSLVENGILDSTGILEVVGFIESTFGITVEDQDLVPEHFDSIAKMVRYIETKQAGAS